MAGRQKWLGRGRRGVAIGLVSGQPWPRFPLARWPKAQRPANALAHGLDYDILSDQ